MSWFQRIWSQSRFALGPDLAMPSLVVALGAVATFVATTSVTVVLEELTLQFGASLATVQWVATGYLLGLAAAISTTGWLARRLGARRLFLASVATFGVASIVCSLASSIEMLIGARVLQGIAGGATMPVGQVILASVAGAGRIGRVMGIVGVPIIIGPLSGPPIAGLLVGLASWRWVFVLHVPLSIAALALGWRLLPRISSLPAGRFDFAGFALMLAGVPLVIYALSRFGETGTLATTDAFVAIVAGLALIALFCLHAARTAQPLMNIRLWRNPSFAACGATGFLVSASLFGSLVLLPLWFQVVRDASAVSAGLLLVPQALGGAISIAVCGALTDQIGGGRVAAGGIALLTVATVPLAFIDPHGSLWLLYAVLFVRGLGMGGSLVPAMAAAYVALVPHEIPDATPQMNVLQRLGGAIGTAIVTVVVGSQLEAPGTAAADAAAAFRAGFLVTTALSLLAIVPAARLAIIDRRRSQLSERCTMGQSTVAATDVGA